MLWYIYKPGTDVYIQTIESVFACVIAEVHSNLDRFKGSRADFTRLFQERGLKYWIITFWHLDLDGVSFSRVRKSAKILPWDGLKELTKLKVCPVSAWDAYDNGERSEKIRKRGKILLGAIKQGHLLARYHGPTKSQRQVSKLHKDLVQQLIVK